jgi:hypothetical protein
MFNGFSVIKKKVDLIYRDTFYIKSSNTDWYNDQKVHLKYIS